MKEALNEINDAKTTLQDVVSGKKIWSQSMSDIIKPFNFLWLILEHQEGWASIMERVGVLVKASEKISFNDPIMTELEDLLKDMTAIIDEVEKKWIGPIEIYK